MPQARRRRRQGRGVAVAHPGAERDACSERDPRAECAPRAVRDPGAARGRRRRRPHALAGPLGDAAAEGDARAVADARPERGRARAPTPAPAVATPTPTPKPTLCADDDEKGLMLAGAMVGAPLGLAGLVGLALFLLARLGLAEDRRANLAHAWREAGYRAGGAWANFTDWVRSGAEDARVQGPGVLP